MGSPPGLEARDAKASRLPALVVPRRVDDPHPPCPERNLDLVIEATIIARVSSNLHSNSDLSLTWWGTAFRLRSREACATYGEISPLRRRQALRTQEKNNCASFDVKSANTAGMTMTFPVPLRVLLRRLAASPGFTTISVLTLAIGIGANLAIFSIVNAVLLRPLPVPDSGRLVVLNHTAPGLVQLDDLPMSDALYFLYANESRTLDGVALFNDGQVSFTGPDNPQRVASATVSASFFDVMRTPPRVGRAFTVEDERPGAPPVVLLSDGLWHSRFGGDPTVVGRRVEIAGAMTEVVGIMPPSLAFPEPDIQLWRPATLDPERAQLGSFSATGFARIGEGRSVEQVQAELAGMASNLVELFPGAGAAPILVNAGFTPLVSPAREVIVGDIQATL